MLWDGDTQANSESVGISGDGQGRDWSANGTVEVTPNEVRLDAGLSTTVAGGIDDITNDGTIVASSAAVVPSFGIAVSVEGAAAAMSASEANSRAAGIDAGTDGDIVMNRGEIIASSLSTAGDLNAVVSKSFAMADNSVFDGGSTATSDAIGIGGDGEGRDWQATGSVNINDHAVRLETELSTTVSGGNDTLDNEGTIVASSAALAPSVAVAVAIDGVAAATSTSLADSRAIGIDAGTGDDTVTNTGSIVSTSLATAAAANVAVGKGAALATGALFEGGTRATSEAVGISGDGEGRDWTAQGSIEVTDEATRLDGSLASTVVSGKDDITNDGTIVATSALC